MRVSKLESPMKLLDKHIDVIKEKTQFYEVRRTLEVDMINSTEEGEDSIVMIEARIDK